MIEKEKAQDKINFFIQEAKKYKSPEEYIRSDLTDIKGFEQMNKQIRDKLEKDIELIDSMKAYKKSSTQFGGGDSALLGIHVDLFHGKFNQQLMDVWREAAEHKTRGIEND